MQTPVEQLTLSLMVARGDGPPIGSLAPDGGEPRSFSGWLELMSVLDAIRDAADDDGDDGEPHRASGSPVR